MSDIKIESQPTAVKLETPSVSPDSLQVDKSPSSDVLDLDEITTDKSPSKPTEKPVEESHEADIPESAPESKLEEPTKEEPKPDVRPEPAKRDFSAFEDEDKEIAKLAPNKTFNLLKERLPKLYAFKKEAQELKEKIVKLESQLNGKYIPEAWAEHPEAYTLTDDYRELNSQFSRIDFESKHWREQLIALKRGEQWKSLTGFDKEGNPVYSQPIDPIPEHEVALNSALNDANFAKNQVLQQANQIKDNFKNIHGQAVGVVKDYLLKAVDKLPAEQKPVKEDIDLFTKNIPPQLRANVMTEVAANLFGIVKRLSIELTKIKSSTQKSAAIASDAKAAGPKVQKVTSGKTTKAEDVIDFSKLEDEMKS
jgi:hypothetical protein